MLQFKTLTADKVKVAQETTRERLPVRLSTEFTEIYRDLSRLPRSNEITEICPDLHPGSIKTNKQIATNTNITIYLRIGLCQTLEFKYTS